MTNASGFQTRLLAGLRAPAGGETPPQDPCDFSVVLGGSLGKGRSAGGRGRRKVSWGCRWLSRA